MKISISKARLAAVITAAAAVCLLAVSLSCAGRTGADPETPDAGPRPAETQTRPVGEEFSAAPPEVRIPLPRISPEQESGEPDGEDKSEVLSVEAGVKNGESWPRPAKAESASSADVPAAAAPEARSEETVETPPSPEDIRDAFAAEAKEDGPGPAIAGPETRTVDTEEKEPVPEDPGEGKCRAVPGETRRYTNGGDSEEPEPEQERGPGYGAAAPVYNPSIGGENPFNKGDYTAVTETPVEDLIEPGDPLPGEGIHF